MTKPSRNQKTDEETPTRNDVPFFCTKTEKTQMRQKNEEPTMDMLDEGEQSVDSNKTQHM